MSHPPLSPALRCAGSVRHCRFAEAELLYRQNVADSSPDARPNFFAHLGISLKRQGRFSEAVATFDEGTTRTEAGNPARLAALGRERRRARVCLLDLRPFWS